MLECNFLQKSYTELQIRQENEKERNEKNENVEIHNNQPNYKERAKQKIQMRYQYNIPY